MPFLRRGAQAAAVAHAEPALEKDALGDEEADADEELGDDHADAESDADPATPRRGWGRGPARGLFRGRQQQQQQSEGEDLVSSAKTQEEKSRSADADADADADAASNGTTQSSQDGTETAQDDQEQHESAHQEPGTPRRGWGRGLFRGRQQQQSGAQSDPGQDQEDDQEKEQQHDEPSEDLAADGDEQEKDQAGAETPRRGWGRRLFRGQQPQAGETENQANGQDDGQDEPGQDDERDSEDDQMEEDQNQGASLAMTPGSRWRRGLFRARQGQGAEEDGATIPSEETTLPATPDLDEGESAPSPAIAPENDQSPDEPVNESPRRGWGRRLFRGRQQQDDEPDNDLSEDKQENQSGDEAQHAEEEEEADVTSESSFIQSASEVLRSREVDDIGSADYQYQDIQQKEINAYQTSQNLAAEQLDESDNNQDGGSTDNYDRFLNNLGDSDPEDESASPEGNTEDVKISQSPSEDDDLGDEKEAAKYNVDSTDDYEVDSDPGDLSYAEYLQNVSSSNGEVTEHNEDMDNSEEVAQNPIKVEVKPLATSYCHTLDDDDDDESFGDDESKSDDSEQEAKGLSVSPHPLGEPTVDEKVSAAQDCSQSSLDYKSHGALEEEENEEEEKEETFLVKDDINDGDNGLETDVIQNGKSKTGTDRPESDFSDDMDDYSDEFEDEDDSLPDVQKGVANVNVTGFFDAEETPVSEVNGDSQTLERTSKNSVDGNESFKSGPSCSSLGLEDDDEDASSSDAPETVKESPEVIEQTLPRRGWFFRGRQQQANTDQSADEDTPDKGVNSSENEALASVENRSKNIDVNTATDTPVRRGWGMRFRRGRQQEQEQAQDKSSDKDGEQECRDEPVGDSEVPDVKVMSDSDSDSHDEEDEPVSNGDTDGTTNDPSSDASAPRGWGMRLFRGRQQQDGSGDEGAENANIESEDGTVLNTQNEPTADEVDKSDTGPDLESPKTIPETPAPRAGWGIRFWGRQQQQNAAANRQVDLSPVHRDEVDTNNTTLNILRMKKATGRKVDEELLYELELFERDRLDEPLTDDELFELESFERLNRGEELSDDDLDELADLRQRRQDHALEERDLERLEASKKRGEKVDEDQLYELRLYKRHRDGDELNADELFELDMFDKMRDGEELDEDELDELDILKEERLEKAEKERQVSFASVPDDASVSKPKSVRRQSSRRLNKSTSSRLTTEDKMEVEDKAAVMQIAGVHGWAYIKQILEQESDAKSQATGRSGLMKRVKEMEESEASLSGIDADASSVAASVSLSATFARRLGRRWGNASLNNSKDLNASGKLQAINQTTTLAPAETLDPNQQGQNPIVRWVRRVFRRNEG